MLGSELDVDRVRLAFNAHGKERAMSHLERQRDPGDKPPDPDLLAAPPPMSGSDSSGLADVPPGAHLTPGEVTDPSVLQTSESTARLAGARADFDLALLGDPDSDPAAHRREWTRLFEHYTPRLDGYSAGRLPERADRDDLLQHIWFKAVLHVRSLPNAGVLWNWLRKVGENRLTDVRRSGAIAARHAEAHAAAVRHELKTTRDSEVNTDAQLEAADLDGEVGRRIAALSEDDRQFVLLVIEKMSHEEIAKRLGLPSAAASRQRWSRLRRGLRGP